MNRESQFRWCYLLHLSGVGRASYLYPGKRSAGQGTELNVGLVGDGRFLSSLKRSANTTCCRTQLLEGSEVTQEIKTEQTMMPRDRRDGREDGCSPISIHETPPMGHLDAISDITLCQASQCLVVSASFNGHIKVWK